MKKGLAAYWSTHPVDAGLCLKRFPMLTLDTGEVWEKSMQEWQTEAFRNILGLPGASCGDKDMLELCGPVGCGKDQIAAAAVVILAIMGPKGSSMLVQSVTRDKSKAIVKCIEDFCFRDPTFARSITISRDKIENKDRNITVTCGSLDGPSTAGVIYDLAILNEVQEWPDPEGIKVYDHMFARRSKKKGRFVVLTNAPYTPKGEWRRDRWENAKQAKSDWHYRQVRIEDCPWITPEDLEINRRNMTSVKFKRWFYCEPSDGRGELVTKEEVARAVVADLCAARDWSRRGRRYLGLDIGVRRDHYSMTLLCEVMGGVVFLEKQECFVPPSDREEVDLAAAKALALHYAKFWGARVMADPYQAAQLIQELEAEGCHVDRIDPTAKNATAMAHAVMDLFRDNRVRIFPNAGFLQVSEEYATSLAQQLIDAEVKDQERGVRIVSKRTKAGHGDQASSFALAALGVARAESFSAPVCVGASEAVRVAAARESLRHRSIRRHEGRYLGPRVESRRLVPRESSN